MANAIVMPKAGNSVEECILSKWRIKVGDQIAKGSISDKDNPNCVVQVNSKGS